MNIQEGRYYVSRSGKVRGPITPRAGDGQYPWKCGTSGHAYTATGRFIGWAESEQDLVEETAAPVEVRGTTAAVAAADLVIEDGVVVKDRDGEAGRPATTEDYQAADIVHLKAEDIAASSFAVPADVKSVIVQIGPGGAGGGSGGGSGLTMAAPADASLSDPAPSQPLKDLMQKPSVFDPAAAADEPYSKRDILEEAIAVVGGRGKSYGRPEDNFGRIARLWNAHIQNRFRDSENDLQCLPELDAQDVSMMMALMKIARLENDANHHDSWVDVAGYAACGGELAAYNRAAKAE